MWSGGAGYGDAMHDDGERRDTEPEQTVEAADADHEIRILLSDPVYLWRAKVCADAGFTPAQSRTMALDRRIDVRWVVDHLINRGCDTHTAFDIASYA